MVKDFPSRLVLPRVQNYAFCSILTFFAVLWFTSIALIPPINALTDEKFIIVRVDGSVVKICQIVGDFDKELNQSTIGLTYTRYGVTGTDLGASFEHDGRLIFLFGDTLGRNAFPNSDKDDSFAYTFDENPNDGLNLTFYTGLPGMFLPPIVPGVSQKSYEVPIEGIDADGHVYAFFTTNHTEEKTMGSSVIARFNDTTLHFTYLYTLSTERFINVHVAIVNNSEIHGLPETTDRGLLIWGSGEYRESDPYLSYIPLESIENRTALKYFAGIGGDDNPIWSANESDAQPLFHDPVIGEFSVTWIPHFQRWIMLYDGVSMRSSQLPWGDWSPKQVLFNAFIDNGYGHFIHWPGHDNVSDFGRSSIWGGPYGPYLIDKYTRSNNETSTIFFTLSTWNPYTTVLMRADLKFKSIDEIPEWSNNLLLTAIVATLFSSLLAKILKKSPHVRLIAPA